MTAPNNKPITQEQLDNFKYYKDKNPSWGSLHIVLCDQSIKDADVTYCMNEAERIGDHEGYALAKILLTMSKSQRLKLSRRML